MSQTTRFPILGFRRGGSSIFFQLIELLCKQDRVPCFDMVGHYQSKNLASLQVTAKTYRDSFVNNVFVGVFRDFPQQLNIIAKTFELKPIVIVRDPLDCALSWYHARMIHALPKKKNDATWDHNEYSLSEYIAEHDDFHLHAQSLVDNLQAFDCLYIRYEDFIRSPMKTLSEIMIHTDFEFSRHAVDLYSVHANFLHMSQDKEVHNRSGLSGSMLESCTSHDLKILYTRYSKIIRKFGYGDNYGIKNNETLPWDRLELDCIKRICATLLEENHHRQSEMSKLSDILSNLSSLLAKGQVQSADFEGNMAKVIDAKMDIDALKFENGQRIEEISRLSNLVNGIAQAQAQAQAQESSRLLRIR